MDFASTCRLASLCLFCCPCPTCCGGSVKFKGTSSGGQCGSIIQWSCYVIEAVLEIRGRETLWRHCCAVKRVPLSRLWESLWSPGCRLMSVSVAEPPSSLRCLRLSSVFSPSLLRLLNCSTCDVIFLSPALVLTCCVSRDVKTWHLTSRVSCLRKKSIYLSSCLSHHNRHSCHDSLFIIGLWYATVTSPRLVSTPPARCWLRPLRPPCFFYTF